MVRREKSLGRARPGVSGLDRGTTRTYGAGGGRSDGGSCARALRALRAHGHGLYGLYGLTRTPSTSLLVYSSSLKLLRHPASLVSFRQASLDAHLRLHRPTPAWAFLAGLSALGP